MSAHYKEHRDALMSWSWKLFCHRWVRLIRFSAEEAERREEQRRQNEYDRLRAAHNARLGGQ